VRHGPQALLQSEFPALLLAQDDESRSGMEELARDLVGRRVPMAIAGVNVNGATVLPTIESHTAIARCCWRRASTGSPTRSRLPAASIRTARRSSARSPRRTDGARARQRPVLTDDGFAEGRAVLIEGERIVALTTPDDPRCKAARRHDLKGAMLLPGFLDTQVNGGGGRLFNDAPTVETIRVIGNAHRRFGTTGFLPTLISDDLSVIARAIAAVREAIAAKVPGVIGVHIEGPFINAERKGAHDAAKMRDLDDRGVALLRSLGWAGRS